MKINITARHFKAKVSTQNYITEKINELDKYNENIIHADVILSFDKPPADTKHCEIIIKLKDKTLTAKESAGDFEKAIDFALTKIDSQIYKLKDKLKTKNHAKTN
ncbi:MAG: ribosome-associated translation inhibitor RaiA [Ignavibacteria bacterium]|nr:ribosome-associated translation inhibitor RaiA [Ignavibacteria bacterium]